MHIESTAANGSLSAWTDRRLAAVAPEGAVALAAGRGMDGALEHVALGRVVLGLALRRVALALLLHAPPFTPPSNEGCHAPSVHPRGSPCGTVHLVVNDPFKALSHPIRRGIVERLADGPATVGVATAGFGVSKPAITKHLKVLEETGVVTRTVEGRTHRLSLQPDVMSEAADWMDRQRAQWERLFDVVDEYLKESP